MGVHQSKDLDAVFRDTSSSRSPLYRHLCPFHHKRPRNDRTPGETIKIKAKTESSSACQSRERHYCTRKGVVTPATKHQRHRDGAQPATTLAALLPPLEHPLPSKIHSEQEHSAETSVSRHCASHKPNWIVILTAPNGTPAALETRWRASSISDFISAPGWGVSQELAACDTTPFGSNRY